MSVHKPPRPQQSTLAERAAQLPAPQPGKAVTIPLELLPDWLKLHKREIISFDARRGLLKGQPRPGANA